jgi:hypothetical protein
MIDRQKYLERQRRYNRSVKGGARALRYERSAKGRRTRMFYDMSTARALSQIRQRLARIPARRAALREAWERADRAEREARAAHRA